jgi:hypothetical protein
MSKLRRTITLDVDSSNVRSEFRNMEGAGRKAFKGMSDEASAISSQAVQDLKGVGDSLKQLQTDTKDIFRMMLEDSKKIGRTHEQRVKLMRQELAQFQKASRDEASQARAAVNLRRANLEKYKGRIRPEQMLQHRRRIDQASAQNRVDVELDKQRNELLRRLIDQYEDDAAPGESRGPGAAAYAKDKVLSQKDIFGAVLGGTLAGFGINSIVGGISTFISSSIQGGLELQRMRGGMYGMIADSPLGINQSQYIGSGAGATALGINQAEILKMSRMVAVTAGTSYAAREEAVRQARFERAFGMETGALTQAQMFGRVDQRGRMASEIAEGIYKVFRATGGSTGIPFDDLAQLPEKIEQTFQIVQRELAFQESMDTTAPSLALAKLGGLGGSFSDFRAAQTLSTISDSIRNPKGDYANALVLSSFGQRNPQASFADLLLEQERGIFGGSFGNIMENLAQMSGRDRDVFQMNIAGALGLNQQQSRLLADSFLSGTMPDGSVFSRDRLNALTSQGELDALLANPMDQDIAGRAGRFTGTVDQVLARVEDDIAQVGEKITRAVEPFITDVLDAWDESSGLIDFIGKSFRNLFGTLGEAMGIDFEGIAKGLEEVKQALVGLNPFNWNFGGNPMRQIGNQIGNLKGGFGDNTLTSQERELVNLMLETSGKAGSTTEEERRDITNSNTEMVMLLRRIAEAMEAGQSLENLIRSNSTFTPE